MIYLDLLGLDEPELDIDLARCSNFLKLVFLSQEGVSLGTPSFTFSLSPPDFLS